MTLRTTQDQQAASSSPPAPGGLATLAGALADWDDLGEALAEIYAARRSSADRPAPDFD